MVENLTPGMVVAWGEVVYLNSTARLPTFLNINETPLIPIDSFSYLKWIDGNISKCTFIAPRGQDVVSSQFSGCQYSKIPNGATGSIIAHIHLEESLTKRCENTWKEYLTTEGIDADSARHLHFKPAFAFNRKQDEIRGDREETKIYEWFSRFTAFIAVRENIMTLGAFTPDDRMFSLLLGKKDGEWRIYATREYANRTWLRCQRYDFESTGCCCVVM